MASRRMSEVERHIRQSAIQRGIDPDVAVEVARREGGLSNPTQRSYARKNGIREPSFGPFQLLEGGQGTGYPRGLGNAFVQKYGVSASDPRAWRAGVDFALDTVRNKGWGQWYGARNAGITGFTGVNRRGPTPPADIPNQPVGIMSAINPPASATPMARPMSLAEQYGLLDQARGMQRDIGLLRQDVAAQDPMGQLKRDLIARNKAYEMATAPAPGGLLESLPEAPVTTVAAPQEVEVPTVTAYEQTPATNTPFDSVMSPQGGLLSPDEMSMVDAQQARLAEMGPNRGVQFGRAAKKGLSAFGGGVLGGMLLGPLGAVAGGLLGPTIVNGMTSAPNFPKAPDSKPRGDGRMTEYGERVQRESRQFDRAVRSGKGGLW